MLHEDRGDFQLEIRSVCDKTFGEFFMNYGVFNWSALQLDERGRYFQVS